MSGALYLLFRSPSVALWSFAGGTLIDLDHIYDYLRHRHRPPLRRLDLRHFFDVLSNGKLDRVFLPLHSWELMAAGLAAGWLWPSAGRVLIPLFFGMMVHLLFDSCTNRVGVSSYSIVGRCAHGFDGRYFFRK